MTRAKPAVYTVATGENYAACFARGFHARFADCPPEVRAKTVIFVNTARARLLIEQALADFAPTPGFLPRLRMVQDLAEDVTLAPGLPPALPEMRRKLRLIRLVERFIDAKAEAQEPVAPISAAPDLADALALLIDQFHDGGLTAAALDDALKDHSIASDAARHWQDTLAFVDLIRSAWPEIQAQEEGGRLDPRARQRAVIDAQIARWQDEPPSVPVLVAASTGSVAAMADLMAAVAKLPAGAVVLPGLYPETDAETWHAVGPDHPMGPFRGLLDRLSMVPTDVPLWVEADARPRRRLLAQALRPAPVTDHWHEAAPSLLQEVSNATGALTLIEAETHRQEAAAIALVVREVLEVPDRRVSVITPNAALARRISAELTRFSITPDDIMGQPLAQAPAGVLARLVLKVAEGDASAITVSGLLTHPMVSPGIDRKKHLEHARAYERAVLRATPRPATDLLPEWPDAEAEQVVWLTAVQAMIEPLAQTLAQGCGLADLAIAHRVSLQSLSDSGDGAPKIWSGDDGTALERFFSAIIAQADALGPGSVRVYQALLAGLMRDVSLPSLTRERHPRVALRGPREARLEDADVTVLAGLNDGDWPAAPDPGPWLSRPMYASLGLPLPERSVGLSAHDFMNAACRGEVVLSRSRRIDGDPAVASRWLIRLETLLTGIGAQDHWQSMIAKGDTYLAMAKALTEPQAPAARTKRPGPIVPMEAFPKRLAVTEIDILVRDAYAIYAKRVLGLHPLGPIGRRADARERGTILHDVLEQFTEDATPWPGSENARLLLGETADRVLTQRVPWPDLRRAWRARIARLADWFIDREAKRRTEGHVLGTEIVGAMALSLGHGEVEIAAKADRIDQTGQGAVIYDYKTGTPPTNDQTKAGFSHQIHLQAAILACGGFKDVPAMGAHEGVFIGLTGAARDGGGIENPITLDRGSISDHRSKVQSLLQAYANGAPFLSHGRPFKTTFAGDYDHLARVGEWSIDDTSDGGE